MAGSQVQDLTISLMASATWVLESTRAALTISSQNSPHLTIFRRMRCRLEVGSSTPWYAGMVGLDVKL